MSPNEPIGSLMARFRNGRSHMAIVTDDIKQMESNMKRYLNDDGSIVDGDDPDTDTIGDSPKVLGVVTLEDVIESALKEDILDEADYDIENDVNINLKDKSFEASDGGFQNNNGTQKEALQNIIKDRINKLTTGVQRKYTANFDSIEAGKPSLIEMNDLKDTLLDKTESQLLAVHGRKASGDGMTK